MSGSPGPRALVGKHLGWQDCEYSVEKLAGGLTNDAFRLRRGDESFALRLDAAHTRAFALDRRLELSILKNAAAGRLAPEVVFAEPGEGILVTRFVEGRVWTAADLDDTGKIERLARLLRQVHALPRSGHRFRAGEIAAAYVARLDKAGAMFDDARRCLRIVGTAGIVDSYACCHNDVVLQNVIGDRRPMLIDWEYACDNDPLFDLASVIGYHELNEHRSAALLSAYVGGPSAEHRERLETQLAIYDALHFLWLALRQSISPHENQARRLAKLKARIA